MTPDVTELVVLDPDRLDGVGSPANGASSFLLLKAAADGMEKCGTCDGSGKILQGNRECPDCKGKGEVAVKSDSAEADEQEEEMTGSDAEKALSAADRKAMPASSFAFVDKNGGKHLPIHDEGHVKSALGRFGQQDFSEAKGDPGDAKKKAAAKIKAAAGKHGIEVDDKSEVAEAAAKGAIQDALDGTKTPETGGHLDTGKSGMSGSVAPGVRMEPDDSTEFLGGQSTANIPLADEIRTNMMPSTLDGAGITNPQAIAKSLAVASLVEAMQQVEANRQAIKDGKFLDATGPAAENPGSMPWESYDAATLRQVAECLAGCCSALDNIAERERMEARVADADDLSNAWDLEEAAQALEYALGVTARLSYHEAAEGEATKSAEFVAKVGRKLSGKNEGALRAARDHLNAVIDGAQPTEASDAGSTSEEEDMALTVTKDELGELVVKSVKAVLEQEKKDKKAAKRLAEEEAAKNANNGGDISEADIKPTKSADADDVNSIPDGGSVDPQYVNKSTEDNSVLTKQVSDQLEDLKKDLDTRLGSVEEMVAKFSKRPRSGGPSLDGQLRVSDEGRLGEAAKSEDGVIEQLEKSLEDAADPVAKERIGEQLSVERLKRFYASRGFAR